MRTMVMREVEVLTCDFCGEEDTRLHRCLGCGKEMCDPTLPGHGAYYLHLTNRTPLPEGKRDASVRDASGSVCVECAASSHEGTVGELLERLYWGKYIGRSDG